MAVLSKNFIDHMLDSPIAEGIVRGGIVGALTMVGLLMTDELFMGLIMGGLGGLCLSECAMEKFHIEDEKPWHELGAAAFGLFVSAGTIYAIAVSLGLGF